MSDINIEVAGGTSIRLLTAGKYCDKNIVITALGGGENTGRLPSGFTELTHIRCSGGQYFDSDYTPNNKTRIETRFTWAGGSNGYLYGAADSNNAKAFTSTLSASGGNWRFDGTLFQFKAVANTLYTAIMDSSGVTINGTLNKYTGSVSAFTALNTLAVCGGKNANGSISSAYFVGDMDYYKIYEEDVLVRDYVPCENASGEIGFYELVNNVFKGNEGTGEFIGGEIVEPSEYPIWTGGYY